MENLSSASLRQAHENLNQLLDGYQLSAVVICAVRIGLIDALSEKPLSLDAVASRCDVALTPLHRLLLTLEALMLCRITASDEFELTDQGRLLSSHSKNNLHYKAKLIGEQYWPAWHDMEHSLRTGRPAFDAVLGEPVWEYRENNPSAGINFQNWLGGVTEEQAQSLAPILSEMLIVCDAKTVADIGGGSGALLKHLLYSQPNLEGILVDSEIATSAALERIDAALRPRLQVIIADFFKTIPVKADAYILKSVLHDWEDKDAATLLQNVRAAMATGNRMFLIERTIDDGTLQTRLLDLHMLTVTGGRERTQSELEYLLSENNLTPKTTRRVCGFTIIEAIRE